MAFAKRRETLAILSPRPMSPESSAVSSVEYLPAEPHHMGVPDGGRRAWLVVLGGFINFTASFGLINSFGTFEAEYEDALLWNTSTATWIGSAQMFVLFFGGIFVGPAFDRWGARKLMLTGTFLCLVALISCSFAREFYQFLLAQGILFGLGSALLFYPVTSSVSEWFDKNRGLALGVVVSGASAGGILWPIILNQLFITLKIQWTHRVSAAIAIPMMLISCLLVRERKSIAGHDTAGNEIKASQRSVSKAICDARFLGLSGALLFINCGMMLPFFYIPQYAKNNHFDGTTANNLLAISYAASLVGRIFTGWVSDHVGSFLIVFSLLFGFSSGGVVPLGSACVAQTTPDMGYIGLRIGVMMAICSAGTLAGGPAAGAIKDATGEWGGVFVFSSAVTMSGTAILFVTRMIFSKRLVF
ncbi:monocarboxylate transporter, putative [Cordyceps militaris CM01]|uniref:Monocarboxylate transporter, putative n=1 Tax=Cordyceps militaris (strain CM01) TaxID=983644 RepID=G3J4W7_CORMM|nr:monocarboxylate transporter, putative [Cordyceps militaris CM01]EGX95934.1 monocarboxylate transporter, putative [Cordyceps militaris CM01]